MAKIFRWMFKRNPKDDDDDDIVDPDVPQLIPRRHNFPRRPTPGNLKCIPDPNRRDPAGQRDIFQFRMGFRRLNNAFLDATNRPRDRRTNLFCDQQFRTFKLISTQWAVETDTHVKRLRFKYIHNPEQDKPLASLTLHVPAGGSVKTRPMDEETLAEYGESETNPERSFYILKFDESQLTFDILVQESSDPIRKRLFGMKVNGIVDWSGAYTYVDLASFLKDPTQFIVLIGNGVGMVPFVSIVRFIDAHARLTRPNVIIIGQFKNVDAIWLRQEFLDISWLHHPARVILVQYYLNKQPQCAEHVPLNCRCLARSFKGREMIKTMAIDLGVLQHFYYHLWTTDVVTFVSGTSKLQKHVGVFMILNPQLYRKTFYL